MTGYEDMEKPLFESPPLFDVPPFKLLLFTLSIFICFLILYHMYNSSLIATSIVTYLLFSAIIYYINKRTPFKIFEDKIVLSDRIITNYIKSNNSTILISEITHIFPESLDIRKGKLNFCIGFILEDNSKKRSYLDLGFELSDGNFVNSNTLKCFHILKEIIGDGWETVYCQTSPFSNCSLDPHQIQYEMYKLNDNNRLPSDNSNFTNGDIISMKSAANNCQGIFQDENFIPQYISLGLILLICFQMAFAFFPSVYVALFAIFSISIASSICFSLNKSLNKRDKEIEEQGYNVLKRALINERDMQNRIIPDELRCTLMYKEVEESVMKSIEKPSSFRKIMQRTMKPNTSIGAITHDQNNQPHHKKE